MENSLKAHAMKVIILLLLALNMSAQNGRINTMSEGGFPMVTIYPYTPLTFVFDDGDTATVNILKDSISVYRGKYALYVYFHKYQYGRLYDVTVVLEGGEGVTLKPSYVDSIEAYYEYEVDMATLSYLATRAVIGLLFEADGVTMSCIMDSGKNHFKEFLNKN